MTEFLIVILPVLIFIFSVFEMGRWYIYRQTLSFALQQAARVGATHHGKLHDMQQQFAYTARMLAHQPWTLSILSPTASDFRHFSQRAADGRLAIRHLYLPEQGEQAIPAHTLHLQLHYYYRPIVPWLRPIVGQQVLIQLEHKVVMQSDYTDPQTSSAPPTPVQPPPLATVLAHARARSADHSWLLTPPKATSEHTSIPPPFSTADRKALCGVALCCAEGS